MILTRDRILAHAADTPLEVPAGTMLTSLAREEAAARGITIVEGAAAAASGGSCACGANDGGGACSCAAPTGRASSAGGAAAASGPDWSDRLSRRRGADPSLWRPGGPSGAAKPPAPSAPIESAREAERRVLGPPDTHVDACTMGGAGGVCREDVVVVTAVGRNRPHVLAELATGIAEVGGDIQEISQRIVDGWFHTILTVDMSRAPGAFPEAKAALEGLSRDDDYTVRVQHERVFRYMHRI
ncbi:MAG: ACT domain-containing protein [Planctomycetota bacterium JB042]